MSKMFHNSAPYGEQLREDIERLLNEDAETLFIYAQWHIGDYIAGTQGMNLEHEGAYQRFLMRLYSRGKPLPDDDNFMARLMSLSTRVWKRIKEALIIAGKIITRNGCLTNTRFEKERLRRAEQLQKRADAANLRWQRERENQAEMSRQTTQTFGSLPEVSPKFARSLLETSPKLSQNVDAKSLKTNDSHHASAYANQYPLTNNQEISLKGDTHARGNGRDFWAKALNPMQAKAHADIHRDPQTGDIVVLNGMACRLEAILKGRCDLKTALSMVKGKINPDAAGMYLANRVESVLAEWVMEQEQRDQRASATRQQQFTRHGKDLGTIPGWREEQLANKRRVDEALEQYKREREARV